MKAIDQLADFIAGTNFDSMPKSVVSKAKEGILDFLGCTLAGSRTPVGKKISDYVRDQKGFKAASVIGQGFKTSPGFAALANGVMAHAEDFDDLSFSVPGHPTVPVLPPVLGVAEAEGLSGRAVLSGYVIGFELECKLGRSLAPRLYQRGWHATSVLGYLGAAAASSHLLKLDTEKIKCALGIACSMASGLRANLGSMTKPLHVGLGAQNGVAAAFMAKDGMTAMMDAVDGENGLFKTFAGIWNADAGLNLLGNPFDFASPGITFKQYPSCAETHPALDAVIGLVEENHLASDDIAAVECLITPMDRDVLVYHRPRNATEGKFSLEFCVALGIVERKAGLKEFVDDKVREPKIVAAMEKVSMEADPQLSPDGYTGAATIVNLKLKNGMSLQRRVDEPKGTPEHPLTQGELTNKFRMCASLALEKGATEKILELVLKMETMKSVRPLMNLLRGKP